MASAGLETALLIEQEALPEIHSGDSVPNATPSSTGKRGIVPKRRFQTGTFVKRGDNWIGMWRIDVMQPDGTIKREQRSKTFVGMSERAARATFQPILDAVNKASGAVPPVPKSATTLNRLIDEWREQIAMSLKPSSRKATESHLRCHIKPSLGDYALSDLTAKRLQAFVTDMSNGKRTRKTIENILLTLSSILSTARDWGYDVPKVTLSDLSLPQDLPRERVHCFTRDEMRSIIRLATEPLSTICLILSLTGMRIGEVLALRREHLDFRRKVISIRGAVYEGKLGTPKSQASMADLPMPEALVERLRDYEWNPAKKENPLGFLFLNLDGRPYSANRLRERKLHRVLAKLGIKQTGFHSFRHGVASELIDSGAPITVVQTQMRHSDPRITLGIYGHVIPQSQRAAIESLAGSIAD
jgi:integrase